MGAGRLRGADDRTGVARILKPDLMQMTRRARRSYLETLSVLIRKNAHFCEFMLLGFNLMGFMHFRDLKMPRPRCRLWAWGLATAYAVTDELHQLFINERAAMVIDVLIDSAGSLIGTLVMTVALVLLAKVTER